MKSPSVKAVDPYVISIVELDFHFDCLDALIKIFQNSIQQIHVFTTTENIKLLNEINYSDNVVFHEYKPFSKFLYLLSKRKILKSSDVIFINTIATNFGAYLAVPNPQKTILRVHNINKQFAPFKSIKYPDTLKGLWTFSSYVGREIVLKLFPLFRKLINSRVQYFTFPDNGLMQFALSKRYIDKSKTIESIPFKVFAGETQVLKLEDEFVITIIGATDPTRRNYQDVIHALQKIYSFKSPKIKLILLGKIKGNYGVSILGKLNKIESDNFRVQFFDKNIPEKQFVQLVKETHLIISPIVAETKTDIFKEYYGQTKTSGSILDFMKFGIVTMTPSSYKSPRELEGFFKKYDDEDDLVEKLLYFYENPKVLDDFNYKSKKFVMENYNTEKIYATCKDSLKSILNKDDN